MVMEHVDGTTLAGIMAALRKDNAPFPYERR